MNRTAPRLAGAASLLLVLASCETATRPMTAGVGGGGSELGYNRPQSWSGAAAPRKSAAAERPGLGTKLGGEIYDRSEAARFYRRLPDVPDAVATFHYNDEEGAKVMAQLAGTAHKHGGDFTLIPGKLEAAVEPRDWGNAFDHYESGGKVFVIGRPGGSYRLRLHNLTSDRLEVVVSIDGLDVLDGQPASVRKRGYVIDKHASITIEGMRVKGTLRELRFSTVAASHAATAFGEKGARNVGVIGVACYAEDETARRRANIEEGNIREGARAFGG
ncbi:MAG: hypothetical protein K1X78_08635 [Verrucomicrobiaceae bacterium]|nr:hypothetical protein [Verrucomicrobiaceae bacterium]